MKGRLTVGQNMHFDIEYIDGVWAQVISVHRTSGVKVGDLVLKDIRRGWMVYDSIESKTPKTVFPNRVSHTTVINDEEE